MLGQGGQGGMVVVEPCPPTGKRFAALSSFFHSGKAPHSTVHLRRSCTVSCVGGGGGVGRSKVIHSPGERGSPELEESYEEQSVESDAEDTDVTACGVKPRWLSRVSKVHENQKEADLPRKRDEGSGTRLDQDANHPTSTVCEETTQAASSSWREVKGSVLQCQEFVNLQPPEVSSKFTKDVGEGENAPQGSLFEGMKSKDQSRTDQRKEDAVLEVREQCTSHRQEGKIGQDHDDISMPILDNKLLRVSGQQQDTRIHSDAHANFQGFEELEQNAKVFKEWKSAVKQLLSGKAEERAIAAAEIRHLARDNASARVTLAMLGAIPPLVTILDAEQSMSQHSALLALLNLAIGNDLNKASIVLAGAVPKMVELINGPDVAIQEAVVAAFLSLSALDRNKPVIGSSGAVPALLHILEHGSEQGQKDALRALYNLSISQANVRPLVEAGATQPLLMMVRDPKTTEKALAMLGNLIGVDAGRIAIEGAQDALASLINVLGWADSPKCQERAVYVLMVIGHHSCGQRQAMVCKGAVSALLEVALLGSTLAQKRASRLLECLRGDREKGRPVSAPILGPLSSSLAFPVETNSEVEEVSEERRVVNLMVQQSLERNLQRMVRRANMPAREFARAEGRKALTGSLSSKSLPY